MTPDPFPTHPADGDIERSAGFSPAPELGLDITSNPTPGTPYITKAPIVAAAPVGPDHSDEAVASATEEQEPAADQTVAADAAVQPEQREPEAEARPRAGDETEPEAQPESGDEAIHTLLRTAATERPVDEVVALVARLEQTGEVSSPANVALRAAAVSRPLDEVRQLVALLNESGYDLHQAETTLRAAAVGRPIEDVVELVNILGTDGDDWRCTGGKDAEERKEGSSQDGGAKAGAGAVPVVAAPPKRRRGSAGRTKSALDGALASGPGSHTTSLALRSALRWPAALALFACGLIHLPTDLASLRSGGYSETLSVVVTVLCLVFGVWLATRDTLVMWAAAAGLAVGVIALHALASVRTVDLLNGSLGATFAWAKAIALLSGAAVVALAGSALLHHTKATGATDGA